MLVENLKELSSHTVACHLIDSSKSLTRRHVYTFENNIIIATSFPSFQQSRIMTNIQSNCNSYIQRATSASYNIFHKK